MEITEASLSRENNEAGRSRSNVMAKRRVLGIGIAIARALGWLIIALGILSIPPVRDLIGPIAGSVSVLSSVALLLAGAVWLVAVEAFLRFFDEYLSRN
jgi:hypothetical protein